MDHYPNAPFALLLFAALGVAVQSFALTFACNVCTLRSISYVRSATLVMMLIVLNTVVAYILETNGVDAVSLVGLAAGLIISTIFLMALIPTDGASAFLILTMSLAVTGAAAFVVMVVTDGRLMYAW
jgi:hypothetical protein